MNTRTLVMYQAQLVTDKAKYKVGENLGFTLAGFPPNHPYYFGIGKQDGSIPWGFGNSVTDADGKDAIIFHIGENVPPGDWVLWAWDDAGANAVSTSIMIEGKKKGFQLPEWAKIAVPALAAVVVVGAVFVRNK